MKKVLSFSLMLLLLGATMLWAESMPKMINFQGLLTDPNGNPVPDEASMIILKVYPEVQGSSPALWLETQTVVTHQGIYSVILGNDPNNPLDLPFNRPYWLGVSVGQEPEMSPRIPLTAAPYAFRSAVADSLLGFSATAGSGWSLTGNAGTNPGTNFLGTTDNRALMLKVNNARVLLVQPDPADPNLPPTWIAGDSHNSVTSGAYGVTIAGGGYNGQQNVVTDIFGTIGGGYGNYAGDGDANPTNVGYPTVGGGHYNRAMKSGSTVSGGYHNIIDADYATIAGGWNNAAHSSYAGISSGYGNVVSAEYSIIGGGMNNSIPGGTQAAIGGGVNNVASGATAWVGGGTGNTASGSAAAVPGGASNLAQGNYSFAAGRGAQALNAGSFVWADQSGTFASTLDNGWFSRCSGGYYLYSNSAGTVGVKLLPGATSWTAMCDRANKENFTPIDKQVLLQRLAELPITEYNLKSQSPAIRHLGPVAQDFATLGYGETNIGINMMDATGVALTTIQALYQRVRDQDAKITNLEQRLSRLEALRAEK